MSFYTTAQVSQADIIIPDNIKNGETILGVQGTYEGKVSLSFNTVAATYEEVDSFIERYPAIKPDGYPFFYITNISRPLIAENQHYAISTAQYNFNIGEVISSIPGETSLLYKVEPNKMVLYYADGYAYEIPNIVNYQDNYIYNLTLYIVEEVDHEEATKYYKIVDKGISKLNALYPIYLKDIGEENTLELYENGELIDSIRSKEDTITKKTFYGHNYQIKAIPFTDEKFCWVLRDGEASFLDEDYQYPTYFRPEQVQLYLSPVFAWKSDLRKLVKAGISFECYCNHKLVDDELVIETDSDSKLILITTEQISSGKILFEIHNSYTEKTYRYNAIHEDDFWMLSLERGKDLREILEGNPNTVITITCKNETYKTSTYIHDNNSTASFIITKDGTEIHSGGLLQEGDDITISSADGSGLPKYSAIYINGNLFRKLDYPDIVEIKPFTEEFISEEDQTVIRVDLETPPTATITIENNSSSILEVQKRMEMMGTYFWSTIESGRCNPNSTIEVQVETNPEYYRIKTSLDNIGATLTSGSVYHSEEKDNMEMDIVSSSNDYVLNNTNLYMLSGMFNLYANDRLSFTIINKIRDYILLDNTEGTGGVTIRSNFGYTHKISVGETYELQAQTYMYQPMENYTIESENNAIWVESGSETPIYLNKDNSYVCDPEGNQSWHLSLNSFRGYLGTVTFYTKSSQPLK